MLLGVFQNFLKRGHSCFLARLEEKEKVFVAEFKFAAAGKTWPFSLHSSFFLTSPFTWFLTQEHRENSSGSLVQKPLPTLMVFSPNSPQLFPPSPTLNSPSLSKVKPNPPLSHHDDDDQFLAEVPPDVDEDTWTEVLHGFALMKWSKRLALLSRLP